LWSCIHTGRSLRQQNLQEDLYCQKHAHSNRHTPRSTHIMRPSAQACNLLLVKQFPCQAHPAVTHQQLIAIHKQQHDCYSQTNSIQGYKSSALDLHHSTSPRLSLPRSTYLSLFYQLSKLTRHRTQKGPQAGLSSTRGQGRRRTAATKRVVAELEAPARRHREAGGLVGGEEGVEGGSTEQEASERALESQDSLSPQLMAQASAEAGGASLVRWAC